MRHTRLPGEPTGSFWRSKPGVVLGMLAVIALFYVAREHYAHASLLLPYLILLLCPLMHLFGHRHGQHHHSAGHDETDRKGR
ncbi:hypothetical protein D3C78_1573720 [compost metagenome]